VLPAKCRLCPPPGYTAAAPQTAARCFAAARTFAPIIGRYEHEEITPSIDVAAKSADALNVTVDYLIGHSENMVMDKNLVRRMEDIEALPTEEKDKVYYFIDMALAYNKTKKAFAH
jgi:transcriptional regulator with XRE-family HTH domain